MKRNRIQIVLEMIKFEHSVFALPFALTGALLAARASRNGWPTLRQIAWIVVAMVAARSAAMTVNRIVDLRYDRENPRTSKRALATGDLSGFFSSTPSRSALPTGRISFSDAHWEFPPQPHGSRSPADSTYAY